MDLDQIVANHIAMLIRQGDLPAHTEVVRVFEYDDEPGVFIVETNPPYEYEICVMVENARTIN